MPAFPVSGRLTPKGTPECCFVETTLVGTGAHGQLRRRRITLSTRQPVCETLESEPIRQRNCTGCPALPAGRFTSVVMNPLELPLQQARDGSSGFVNPVLMPV